MAITFTKGDLFTQHAEAIVNTVNCVGVMGRGVALQFKKRYPDNFREYENACKRQEVVPGKMFVNFTGSLVNPKYIINFPTKRHWKGKSKIEDIKNGLDDLIKVIRTYDIKSIALPPLGSGLGGLDWQHVKALIASKLEELVEVDIIVFEPHGTNSYELKMKNMKAPNMTPGRAALVGLIHRYLTGLLDPYITLLEVHKLMYFLQVCGEPLRLNFTKAAYGPYAENLRHVLHAIEGHFITGYSDGGDKPDKQLNLIPGTYEDANGFLQKHPGTLNNFQRVSELVKGFESSFGLELLSTVHWVVTHNKLNNLDDLVDKVYSWNSRKKQFTKRQILVAYERLNQLSWLPNLGEADG